MRMFTIYSRAIPGCCTTPGVSTLVEVECEKISPMEDPSVMWLPAGEFKVRILKPEFMYEPKEVSKDNGAGVLVKEKITVPPIYYGHFLYETREAAQFAIRESVVRGFEFEIRKKRMESYTEEDVTAKCAEIKEVLLK